MIKGILFDMDGLMVDTEKLLSRFWCESARSFGYPMTPEHVLGIRSLAAKYSEPHLKGIFGEDFARIERLPGMSTVFGDKKSPFGKLHLSLMEKQELITLFEKVIWENLNRVPGWELRVKSLMTDFLVSYSRISSNKKKTGADSSANCNDI